MSDIKYKAVMRFLDVCIPKFDEDEVRSMAVTASSPPVSFHLPLFPQDDIDYVIDDGEVKGGDTRTVEQDSGINDVRHWVLSVYQPTFYHFSQRIEWRQHAFDLNFEVERLRVTLSRSNDEGGSKSLGDLTLERFSLAFSLTKFDMHADIKLRSALHFESSSILTRLQVTLHATCPTWPRANRNGLLRRIAR